MKAEQEVVFEEAVLDNEGIEPFDYEELLYEAWLEERWELKRKKAADASLQM